LPITYYVFEDYIQVSAYLTDSSLFRVKKLREELQIRKGNGEQNLVINYRECKIVSRPPNIQSEGVGDNKGAAAAKSAPAQGEKGSEKDH